YDKLNRVGGVVVDNAFLSTAQHHGGCDTGAENHDVLEVISHKSGRDISKISSASKGEEEGLFPPGPTFRGTQTRETKQGGNGESAAMIKESRKGRKIKLVVYKTEV